MNETSHTLIIVIALMVAFAILVPIGFMVRDWLRHQRNQRQIHAREARKRALQKAAEARKTATPLKAVGKGTTD